MVTFMRNKTAMSDNLKMIEDKLKEYDVKKLSKSGNLKKRNLYQEFERDYFNRFHTLIQRRRY